MKLARINCDVILLAQDDNVYNSTYIDLSLSKVSSPTALALATIHPLSLLAINWTLLWFVMLLLLLVVLA